MCLTIPKQVIAVDKNIVKLKAGKKTETAGHIIGVKKGDWVLTQNGVIIKKITGKEAKEILKIIRTCAASPHRTLFRASREINQQNL